MKFEDKILIPIGSLGVGVILDIIALLFNYESLFSLGMIIIAISLMIICLILYYEIKKYKNKGEK